MLVPCQDCLAIVFSTPSVLGRVDFYALKLHPNPNPNGYCGKGFHHFRWHRIKTVESEMLASCCGVLPLPF